MVQKTISLSKRAYELLKKEKKENESFSDVIERLIAKKDNPWLMMKNKFDTELWEGLNEKLDHLRKQNLTGENNND